MNERTSLLAHLVPTLTRQTENAATKSLAYILNQSDSVINGLNQLIKSSIGEAVEPVRQVAVEVTAEDQSRPDFVGYDAARAKRVIGESKFWAPLGNGQGSAYLKQLASGPSVLMYVVPEARINSLWREVLGDIEGGECGVGVQQLKESGPVRAGREKEGERYLLMVSWRSLLDSLLSSTRDDPPVQSDLLQLKGLTELMDSEAFLPLKKEDFSPEIPRRHQQFVQLVMNATRELRDHGKVVSWTGPIASSYNSIGRYLTISDTTGWLGVHFDLWGRGNTEDTPLWLQLYELPGDALAHVGHIMQLEKVDSNYFPIALELDAELDGVQRSLVSRLEEFAGAIASAPSDQVLG